jgi:hypothetical protein
MMVCFAYGSKPETPPENWQRSDAGWERLVHIHQKERLSFLNRSRPIADNNDKTQLQQHLRRIAPLLPVTRKTEQFKGQRGVSRVKPARRCPLQGFDISRGTLSQIESQLRRVIYDELLAAGAGAQAHD